MTKSWAKGRKKGTCCIRLDEYVHEFVKEKSEGRKMSIKEYISHAVYFLEEKEKQI